MRRSGSLALVTPAMLLLAVLLLVPMAIVALISISARGPGGEVLWGRYSADAYVGLLFDRDFLTDQLVWNSDYLAIFERSFTLSVVTTAIAFLVGFPTALAIAAQPARRRNTLLLLVTIPFWTNQLVRTYSWMLLLRSGGVLDTLARALHLTAGSLDLLYTPFATLVGLVYSNLPYMILPIYVSLERIDRQLVEVAYDLGADRQRVLRRVVMPLAAPGIVGGGILVFVPCLGSFINPELLGGGKTMMIGNLIEGQFGELRNWPLGAALSITLIGLMLGLVGLRRLLSRTERQAA